MSLERKVSTNDLYLDILANPLEAARLHINLMSDGRSSGEIVNKLRDEFYEKLTKFMKSNYSPTGKINNENLDKLFRYRLSDWSVKKNFATVEGYFYSLLKRDY